MLIEYKVRIVSRYIVTRYEETEHTGSSSVHGEFDNFDTAYAVAHALCKAEHDRLGWQIDDPRIRYPLDVKPGTRLSLDPNHHSPEEIADIGDCVVNNEGEIEAV